MATATASLPSALTAAATTLTATTTNNSSKPLALLSDRFPVNSLWDLTLSSKESFVGRVYCTDEVAQAVIVVCMGGSGSSTSTRSNTTTIPAADANSDTSATTTNNNNNKKPQQQQQNNNNILHDVRILHAKFIETAVEVENPTTATLFPPLSQPLNTIKISKKQLEEREKKAIRLAEDGFRHINPKATPEGQACFDRLLKACNEVVWCNGESIMVMNQIRVDPPYTPDSCKIIALPPSAAAAVPTSTSKPTSSLNSRAAALAGTTTAAAVVTASSSSAAAAAAAAVKRQTALADGSLERVRKIVAAANAAAAAAAASN